MICVICNKEFIKNVHNQKYCSKKCYNKHQIEYHKTSNYKKYQKAYYRNIKLKVIEHYSNGTMQCNCCGEKHIEFLTIDHIDCGHKYHGRDKKPNKHFCINMCEYLMKNDFPKGYQILCYNCNCAKGFFGKCPHELEQDKL